MAGHAQSQDASSDFAASDFASSAIDVFESADSVAARAKLHDELESLRALDEQRRRADDAYWKAVRGEGFPGIVLFHGSPQWHGQPRLRVDIEHEDGPGLHLTNRLSTALRYAGTGEQAVVLKVGLSNALGWTHSHEVSFHHLVDCVMRCGFEPATQDRLVKELKAAAAEIALRLGITVFDDATVSDLLLGLVARSGLLRGRQGAALLARLAAHGAQARIRRVAGTPTDDPLSFVEIRDLWEGVEDWVSLYDVAAVRGAHQALLSIEAAPAAAVAAGRAAGFADQPPVAIQLMEQELAKIQADSVLTQCNVQFRRARSELRKRLDALGASVPAAYRNLWRD